MPVLLIVLVCFATFRITRFVTRDKFPPINRFREYVTAKVGKEHWAAYLVRCPWCVSIYIGAALTALTWYYSDVPYPLLVWLTSSAVSGLLAQDRSQQIIVTSPPVPNLGARRANNFVTQQLKAHEGLVGGSGEKQQAKTSDHRAEASS